jgi:hypothetical protein
VSFAAITLRVASQQVFIVGISLSTQSGNFWIHPPVSYEVCKKFLPGFGQVTSSKDNLGVDGTILLKGNP